MPVSSFRIKIILKGEEQIARLGDRLHDFREVFDRFLDRFVRHNRDKFESGRGMEGGGTAFDFETRWKADSPKYSASKRRAGYEDWLMVRTGELMRSLTGRDNFGWYEKLDTHGATFGTLVRQAWYHRETRPVMFLDVQDLNTLRDLFGAYLEGEPPFRAFVPDRGKALDAEFAAIMGSR